MVKTKNIFMPFNKDENRRFLLNQTLFSKLIDWYMHKEDWELFISFLYMSID